MMKIPKQEYTGEFKESAVKRIKDGLTPGAVSKELVDGDTRPWTTSHQCSSLMTGSLLSRRNNW